MQTSDMVENTPQAAVAGASGRPSSEDVLRVLGLEKVYRVGFWRRPLQAVDGLSFVVGKGRIFALLGPNGAGKTTTMKAILDLVHADAGDIRIFGMDHRDPRSRLRVGYLPEHPAFYEHLTAWELMDYYARLVGLEASERRCRIEELLALVGLQNHSRLRLSKYSKGMSQRLGLAQCLLNDPELLILDEPMSGLDPLGRRQVRDLLLELKSRGKTVLLSSHIVHDIEVLADSVGIINNGRLQSFHELSSCQNGPSFEVTLSGWPRESAELRSLKGHGRVELKRAGDKVTLTVPDLESLRDLLDACQRNRAQVRAVATRRTDLEAIYLEAVTQAGPASSDRWTGEAPSFSNGLATGESGRSDPGPASQRMGHVESSRRSGAQQLS